MMIMKRLLARGSFISKSKEKPLFLDDKQRFILIVFVFFKIMEGRRLPNSIKRAAVTRLRA